MRTRSINLSLYKTHQILLPVDNLERSVWVHLPNVSRLEPPGALLVGVEVLRGLLGHLVVAGGNVAAAQADLA